MSNTELDKDLKVKFQIKNNELPGYYSGQVDSNYHAQGFGRYIYCDKIGMYEGQFHKDKFHGFGRKINKDGSINQGFWIDGTFQPDALNQE